MRCLRTGEERCWGFLEALRDRGGTLAQEVEDQVRTILRDVRGHGQEALLRWARDLDGLPSGVTELEIPPPRWEKALEGLSPEDRAALELAAGRIEAFHRRQMQESWLTVDEEGALLGQMVRPLERVGVYVPGGKASYPSSVLMSAIPARVAGVREVIMCSPLSWSAPDRWVLAAAQAAGVDRIFRLGGAQAIGAMAYGAGAVPRVDKIVGPGNVYVATAKRLVFGEVDIDMVAGPSEIVVVADGSVPARWAAADLLSQAEHDELASAVMLTPSEAYAREVDHEVSRLLASSDRSIIAQSALERFGGILITQGLDEAFQIASQIAPEHLELLMERPLEHLHRVRHAGAVFLGPWSPEPMGDYLAGPNHVLPTGGTARFFSPLGVEEFLKRTSVIGFSQSALGRLGESVVRLANLEGLSAHARSVQVRLDGMKRATPQS
jgi:histidinol dehydrogenase